MWLVKEVIDVLVDMMKNTSDTCDRTGKSLPVVTIVMAIHQDVPIRYIKEAVTSVQEQDFTSYEFLVIADGPLDPLQEAYLKEQAERDERIVFHQLEENIGPGGARNVGIMNARGTYLAVADADDICVPGRIGIEVMYLDSHPDVTVVGSACEVVNEEGGTIGYRHLPESPDELRRYAQFFCPLNNPTIMGRASVLKRYGYDETRRKGEDYWLWIRLLKDGYKIANVKEPLIRFRVSADLYKRRVGLHKAKSDFMNRVSAAGIAEMHRKPFVYIFAALVFIIRLMPHKVVEYLTITQDYLSRRRIP